MHIWLSCLQRDHTPTCPWVGEDASCFTSFLGASSLLFGSGSEAVWEKQQSNMYSMDGTVMSKQYSLSLSTGWSQASRHTMYQVMYSKMYIWCIRATITDETPMTASNFKCIYFIQLVIPTGLSVGAITADASV